MPTGKEIIILTTALGDNGAERILTELSNEWVKTGNKVTIVQTAADNESCSFTLDPNVERINIQAERKNRIQWYRDEVRAVVKLLNERENAVALAFLSRSFYILAIASFFTKNKIVFSERNDPTRWPAKKTARKMRDWAFCRATDCVFQTTEAMEHFPSIVRKRGVIIPNPINPNLPERFAGERRKVIISASRLTAQKNLPMLIRAFARLHREFPKYVLEIYGEGEERAQLASMIEQMELKDSVLLPGFSKRIHEIMMDCAMYVCSSDYEGISNSMLEALGMGLPVISTDCPVGGAREMIRNGKNGLLVPVGDEDALYHAMKTLIEDKQLAERISLEACKVSEDYAIDIIAERWLNVF